MPIQVDANYLVIQIKVDNSISCELKILECRKKRIVCFH